MYILVNVDVKGRKTKGIVLLLQKSSHVDLIIKRPLSMNLTGKDERDLRAANTISFSTRVCMYIYAGTGTLSRVNSILINFRDRRVAKRWM